MSYSILGWVEIKLPRYERWRGVIKIDHILESDYNAYEFIFGFRQQNYGYPEPVTSARGIPELASSEVLGSILDEHYLSHTWVSWKELNDSGWQNKGFGEDWWRLLEMTERLAKDYGDENVRLVVVLS